MVWAFFCLLSWICDWLSQRCLLLWRCVIKRYIPNASVPGREGVCYTCPVLFCVGNGGSSSAVGSTAHESRFLSSPFPLQARSAPTAERWIPRSAQAQLPELLVELYLLFCFARLYFWGSDHERRRVPKIPLIEAVSSEPWGEI